MSNLGLERGFRALGIEFRRARVGDRYVLELLRETGGTLWAARPPGHLICLDKTTTGDGLVSALQVLCVVKQSGKTLAELAAGMARYPQTWSTSGFGRTIDLANAPGIQAAVARAEQQLGRARAGGSAGIGHRTGGAGHGRGRGRA